MPVPFFFFFFFGGGGGVGSKSIGGGWAGGGGDWQIFDTINNKGNSLNASYASGTLNNLVPRADVPLGQHQDTELWNNQQALSQSPRVFYF